MSCHKHRWCGSVDCWLAFDILFRSEPTSTSNTPMPRPLHKHNFILWKSLVTVWVSLQQKFNCLTNKIRSSLRFRLFIGDWGICDSVVFGVTYTVPIPTPMPPLLFVTCHALRSGAWTWAFERTRFPQGHQEEQCGRARWRWDWHISCPRNLAKKTDWLWLPGD